MSDAEKLTKKLVKSGATKEKVVEIINSYGDPIDWGNQTLTDIIGTVWDSDLNSGDEPDYYIINEICSQFGLGNVTE